MSKETYPEPLDSSNEELFKALKEICRILKADVGDFDTVEGRTNRPFGEAVANLSEVVVTALDRFVLLDQSDSFSAKYDQIQGILDLFAGTIVGFQVLTSSGTYTPTAGATKGLAIAIGGGGGGGGADGVNTSASGAGGGGGGGGCAIALFNISGTVSYTIGAAGTAGSNAGGDGGAGGTTTLTGIAVATGGAGGIGSGSGGSTRDHKAGGAGGSGSTGALQLTGQDGGYAWWHFTNGYSYGGIGGSAPFGGGGGNSSAISITGTTATLIAGGDGNNYGGGGGGSANHSATTGQAGGAGSQGVIYVIEFR